MGHIDNVLIGGFEIERKLWTEKTNKNLSNEKTYMHD